MVDVSAKVGKTDKVFKAVREQVIRGLDMLHEVDSTAAFLPKPSSSMTIPIYDGLSFPEKQYTTGLHYFVYSSPYALFSTTKTDNGRWVRFSATMGFNTDPVDFLPAMHVDLMDLGITIVSKVVQALETCAQIVFLGPMLTRGLHSPLSANSLAAFMNRLPKA